MDIIKSIAEVVKGIWVGFSMPRELNYKAYAVNTKTGTTINLEKKGFILFMLELQHSGGEYDIFTEEDGMKEIIKEIDYLKKYEREAWYGLSYITNPLSAQPIKNIKHYKAVLNVLDNLNNDDVVVFQVRM